MSGLFFVVDVAVAIAIVATTVAAPIGAAVAAFGFLVTIALVDATLALSQRRKLVVRVRRVPVDTRLIHSSRGVLYVSVAAVAVAASIPL